MLKNVWKLWKKIGFFIGNLISYIISIIIYLIVITPVGIVIRFYYQLFDDKRVAYYYVGR